MPIDVRALVACMEDLRASDLFLKPPIPPNYKISVDAKSVIEPPDPGDFRNTGWGSLFVEFDVLTAQLAQGGKENWRIVWGPNSILGRLAVQKGNPVSGLPPARNITVRLKK